MKRAEYLNLITAYVKSKEHAWADSTKRDEAYRLRTVDHTLLDNPAKQFNALAEKLAPYTMKTMFIRLTDFYDWYKPNEVNPYRKFRKVNARLFKNAYKKEVLNVTFKDAAEKIRTIEDREVREKALFDLRVGTRFFESSEIDADRIITGKGGKRRPLLAPDTIEIPTYQRSYSTYRSRLSEVGLKPHTLRKLTVNQLLEAGLPLKDVMFVMGWASLQTVTSYAQSLDEKTLQEKIAEAMNV
jgi:hypothetical protein